MFCFEFLYFCGSSKNSTLQDHPSGRPTLDLFRESLLLRFFEHPRNRAQTQTGEKNLLFAFVLQPLIIWLIL